LATDGQVAAPASVRVTVFGMGRVGVPRAESLAGRALPGTLRIAGLDGAGPDVRLLVDGLDDAGTLTSQGTARALLVRGAQVAVDVTLAAPLPDADGDGVPDVIDDCPRIADPAQDCRPVCPASAIFCDDFEAGLDPSWSVSSLKGSNTVAVDGRDPFGGQQSLHCTGTDQSSSSIAALARKLPTTLPPTLGVRVYVLAPAGLGPDGFALQLYENFGFSFGDDGTGFWKTATDLGSAGGNDYASSVPIAATTWTCLEVVVTAASATGQHVQAFADGQLFFDSATAQPAPPAIPFTDLYLGYARVPPSHAAEVFADDFVLAPARVGCE
jgi:hypothetical protein